MIQDIADDQSLERMVLDLGRDYYHMSPPELDQLSSKIKAGDMEEVLRVYEKELQVGHEMLIQLTFRAQSRMLYWAV